MSDNTLENNATAEVVAYNLLLRIMEVEGRPLTGGASAGAKVSRNVILDAYSDCLEAVRGKRPRKNALANRG